MVRVHLLDHEGAGITTFESGTELSLEDVRIETTGKVRCEQPCPGVDRAGLGISASDGSHVSVLRGVVSDSALVGLQVATGGTMDADLVTVARNPIGANVQTAGFDVERISRRVRYIDNDQNLDSAQLVVPQSDNPL